MFSSQNEWRFLNLVRWKNPSDLTGSKLFVCGVKDFTALVGVANVMKPMQPLEASRKPQDMNIVQSRKTVITKCNLKKV